MKVFRSDSYKVITHIMKKNNVNFDFQFRVRNYLEYCTKEEDEREREQKILSKLSKKIKDEYQYQIYGKIIREIPLFQKNFSEECMVSLSKIMKKIDVAPEEVLLKDGDLDNSSFYFIFKGEVEFSLAYQALALSCLRIFSRLFEFSSINPNIRKY